MNCELLVCKKVNKHLEEKVAKLDKAQVMSEQYTRRNNIELAGIPNSIRDNDLEETIINICKEHGIGLLPMDIEACHRLPLSNAQATKEKKMISPMSYNHLNITGRVFVNTSLRFHYRFLWGQCKSLVNKNKIHQVFLSSRCCEY